MAQRIAARIVENPPSIPIGSRQGWWWHKWQIQRPKQFTRRCCRKFKKSWSISQSIAANPLAAGSDFSQFTGHFQLVSWWNVVSPQTVSIRTDAINWFPSNWVKFSSFLDWKWSNLTSVMTHFTGAVQNVLHFIWTWPNLDEMLSVSAWFNSISILFCVDLTRPRQLNSFQ